MARKIKKLEVVEETPFLDILSAANISVESIIPTVSKFKDVKKTLCKYRGFVKILRDNESVKNYFRQCRKNGIVALDTETNNSLDIHDNKMVGLCLFTPFNRPAYIPIGHRDKVTNELLDGQVTKDFLKDEIETLKNLKIIYHNAKFDVGMIYKDVKKLGLDYEQLPVIDTLNLFRAGYHTEVKYFNLAQLSKYFKVKQA